MMGLTAGIGMAVAGWSSIGPDYIVYAVVDHCAFLFMVLLVGPALDDVARSRYQVKAGPA